MLSGCAILEPVTQVLEMLNDLMHRLGQILGHLRFLALALLYLETISHRVSIRPSALSH